MRIVIWLILSNYKIKLCKYLSTTDLLKCLYCIFVYYFESNESGGKQIRQPALAGRVKAGKAGKKSSSHVARAQSTQGTELRGRS